MIFVWYAQNLLLRHGADGAKAMPHLLVQGFCQCARQPFIALSHQHTHGVLVQVQAAEGDRQQQGRERQDREQK